VSLELSSNIHFSEWRCIVNELVQRLQPEVGLPCHPRTLARSLARTHARSRARTHARTRTRKQTSTRMLACSVGGLTRWHKQALASMLAKAPASMVAKAVVVAGL
jgi:hypothetical protein